MKISVLIPVYNGEHHLAECVESVLAQDHPDMEILLGDDGSKDGSLKILQGFAARDPRVRWWQNPKNVGLTANTNVCIRQARGEYIKFVHQDDILLSKSCVSKLATALDENPKASMASSRQHLTGSDARPMIFSERSGYFDGKKMIVSSLEQNTNLIGQPSLTMFRTRLGQRGFDERFTGFMDFEMWCHLLEQGDLAYVSEELASWRVHEHHQTARTNASAERDLEHLRFMEVYWAKPWLREAATDRMLFAQIYYLNKKYGKQAAHLTDSMRAQLGAGRFARQWVKHKAGRPLQKLAMKLRPRQTAKPI